MPEPVLLDCTPTGITKSVLAPQYWFTSQSHSVLHSTQKPLFSEAPGLFAMSGSLKPITACRLFIVKVVSCRESVYLISACNMHTRKESSTLYNTHIQAHTNTHAYPYTHKFTRVHTVPPPLSLFQIHETFKRGKRDSFEKPDFVWARRPGTNCTTPHPDRNYLQN